MTLDELKKQPSYDIKLLSGSLFTDEDGSKKHVMTANIQIFDTEKKMTLKSISGVIGVGDSKDEAEKNALDRACELLGEL